MANFTDDLKKMLNFLYDSDSKYQSLNTEVKQGFLHDQIVLFYDSFIEQSQIDASKNLSFEQKEGLVENFISTNDQVVVDNLIDSCMKSFIPTSVEKLHSL